MGNEWGEKCNKHNIFHPKPKRAETAFEKRGFIANNPQKQVYLESIGQTFISGYNTAKVKSND